MRWLPQIVINCYWNGTPRPPIKQPSGLWIRGWHYPRYPRYLRSVGKVARNSFYRSFERTHLDLFFQIKHDGFTSFKQPAAWICSKDLPKETGLIHKNLDGTNTEWGYPQYSPAVRQNERLRNIEKSRQQTILRTDDWSRHLNWISTVGFNLNNNCPWTSY